MALQEKAIAEAAKDSQEPTFEDNIYLTANLNVARNTGYMSVERSIREYNLREGESSNNRSTFSREDTSIEFEFEPGKSLGEIFDEKVVPQLKEFLNNTYQI